jgi:hypothetical protein
MPSFWRTEYQQTTRHSRSNFHFFRFSKTSTSKNFSVLRKICKKFAENLRKICRKFAENLQKIKFAEFAILRPKTDFPSNEVCLCVRNWWPKNGGVARWWPATEKRKKWTESVQSPWISLLELEVWRFLDAPARQILTTEQFITLESTICVEIAPYCIRDIMPDWRKAGLVVWIMSWWANEECAAWVLHDMQKNKQKRFFYW